jgi:initiation factor 1A
MVKNTTGGGRAKCLARKNETQHTTRLRMIEDDGENYAVVRKVFGGNRCEVLCDDLVTRQAIIRGKFTGKNKRRNVIQSETVILVGLREWATVKDGKQEECDVLEVYSAMEVDQLKQRPSFPTDFLDSSIREIKGISSESKPDIFAFSSMDEPEVMETNTSDMVLMETGEEIDIDDI